MVAGSNLPREGKEKVGGDDNKGFGVGGGVGGGVRGGVGWGGHSIMLIVHIYNFL